MILLVLAEQAEGLWNYLEISTANHEVNRMALRILNWDKPYLETSNLPYKESILKRRIIWPSTAYSFQHGAVVKHHLQFLYVKHVCHQIPSISKAMRGMAKGRIKERARFRNIFTPKSR